MFNGKCKVDLYGGTLYDIVNIPYNTNQIVTDATINYSVSANYTWQGRALDTITISVDNYSSIEGMQYCRITTNENKVYWYVVLGIHMLTNKTAEIGLQFDELLTVGINNITGISGLLQRWTVNDDTQFRYVEGQEPINKQGRLNYSYSTYTCINDEESQRPVVGVGYDMTLQPEIKIYNNPDGVSTNIYIPRTGTLTNVTEFSTRIGNTTYKFDDGMRYYLWSVDENSTVYQNYCDIVALGHDINTNAYILPSSSLIGTVYTNYGYNSISGGSTTWSTGYPLSNTGWNNQKTRDIGITFSLFNAITGDSVTLANYELDNSQVDIFCNPYSNGCFVARFKTYMHDTSANTGLVKSCGWQPLSLTANAGAGSTLAEINYVSQKLSLSNSDAVTRMNIAQEQYAGTQRLKQDKLSQIGNIGNSLIGTAMAPLGDSVNNNLVSSGLGTIVTTAVNQRINDINAAVLEEQINTALQVQKQTYYYQQQALKAQLFPTIYAPPDIKFAGATNSSLSAFQFVVMQSSLNTYDLARYDRFFTAYGYNVDGLVLSSPSQLNCRQRFTFIMADDVVITHSNSSFRRDINTTNAIRERFSSGLRIWNSTPVFDYSSANPIVN